MVVVVKQRIEKGKSVKKKRGKDDRVRAKDFKKLLLEISCVQRGDEMRVSMEKQMGFLSVQLNIILKLIPVSTFVLPKVLCSHC